MRKKIFVLLLILSSSTNFSASVVQSSVEKSEIDGDSNAIVESEVGEVEVSSSVFSEANNIEVINESEVSSELMTKSEVSNEFSSKSDKLETIKKKDVKNNNLATSSKVVKRSAKSAKTNVINDYSGNKGQTLTQRFTNGVKTSATLTDSSGKKVRSWSYYANGKVKVAYTWNGTKKLTRVSYDSKGQKKLSYKYYNNGKVKVRVKYSNKVRTETVKYGANGKRSEYYAYYNTDLVKRKVTYKSGVRTKTTEYYKDGTHKRHYAYYNNGKVKQKITYSLGSIKQKVIYNTNGKKSKIVEYDRYGSLNNVYIYYSNGKVKRKVDYDSGSKIKVINYDINGLRTKVYNYYLSQYIDSIDHYRHGKHIFSYRYAPYTKELIGKSTVYSNGQIKEWINYESDGTTLIELYNSKGKLINSKGYSKDGVLIYKILYGKDRLTIVEDEEYYSTGELHIYTNYEPSKIKRYYKEGRMVRSDYGPTAIKKYYDKKGNIIKTEDPVDVSYCNGNVKNTACLKVTEYNKWGTIKKIYYVDKAFERFG